MKAMIPTLAPSLTALLAAVVLWAAPAWAATPGADEPSSREGETPSGAAGPSGADTATVKETTPAKETVSASDIEQLATELYNEGAEAQQAGELQLARARFRAVLSLDPKHIKAKAALAAVEEKLGITDADRTKEKLGVRIPEVSFTQAPVREVVDYLAREADVNIVFHAAALDMLPAGQPLAAGQPAGAGEKATAPGDLEPGVEVPGAEIPGFPGVAPQVQPRTDLITIHLKNVPLGEVLRYVLRYKGLRYVVEEYAILIVPIGWEAPEDMEMEVFRLATGTLGARRIGSDRTDQTGF